MNAENHFIRFDWAIKHLLRDKANFDVLEGFLTVLLGEDIHIVELLESESNQADEEDKFNRVDIKALNSEGHIIIIEVQLTSHYSFMKRVLYGTCKAVTEHIAVGDNYGNVKKVYSISILYCDFGRGDDYVYHGVTTFLGVHTKTPLIVKERVKETVIPVLPETVFPEYYVLRIYNFDKTPESQLDEWMRYLKTGNINPDTTTPGLQAARKKLQYLKMSRKERAAYEAHLYDSISASESSFYEREEGRAEGMARGLAQGRAEGRAEGLAEGRAEGLAEGRAEARMETLNELASRMKSEGIPEDIIRRLTGHGETDS